MEQDNDEMLYTYARENERKVKYNYTYSSVQNSLVASELKHYEKSSTVSHSSFFSTIRLSTDSIPISTSPLPPSPPLSPALIKRLTKTNNNDHLQPSNENIQRRRLQIVPSPPPESIYEQTSFRRNRITDDCIDLTTVSRSSSKTNTNSGIQQQVLIVNSLESLVSLNERSGISLTNNRMIINPLPMTNRTGQLSVNKSTNSHSRNCILNLISRTNKSR